MRCLGQGSDPTGSDSSNFSSDVEKSKTGHNRPSDRQPTTSTSHLPPQGYQPQGMIGFLAFYLSLYLNKQAKQFFENFQ